MGNQGAGNSEGPGAERREAPPASGLPCLSSNNCNGDAIAVTLLCEGKDLSAQSLLNGEPVEGEEKVEKINILTGGHKRSAHCLAVEIRAMAKQFGIERIGFLTLTFEEHIIDIREAQRRFHSVATGILKERYKRGVWVWERQESKRVHFHGVVVLGADIRSGCDFKAIEAGDYSSANKALAAEWKFWRHRRQGGEGRAEDYGFGRHEFLPVKSNEDGIAYYVGSYIGASVRARIAGDKGARLVRYMGYKGESYIDSIPGSPTYGQLIKFSTRTAKARFGWNTENSWIWRHKLKAWATRNGCDDTDKIAKIYGPRWCYHLQEEILREPVHECFPSEKASRRSRDMEQRDFRKELASSLARYESNEMKVNPPAWDEGAPPAPRPAGDVAPAVVYPLRMLP